jgi:ornithine cyclodeaminase
MLYLSEPDLRRIGTDWNATIDAIESGVRALAAGDFAQPIKPYLRFRDKTNRIIAMPAFVGGKTDRAGIKWIASFPRNIDRGIPRAHSVMVINDASTGQPVAVVNGALLSVIRTASVSGLFLKKWLPLHERRALRVGITGWGPIGRNHLAMCQSLLGDRIAETRLFDLRPIDPKAVTPFGANVRVVDNWRDAYDDADVFITCTASDHPYIDRAPKAGSLQLNVSLRDYKPIVLDWVRGAVVVDDWEEVCRERTDIEIMHLERGLNREDTKSIVDVVTGDFLATLPRETPVMFNPMGMAVFDIVTASHFIERAEALGVGTNLD